MQTSIEQLVRQQLILRELGFYIGPIDGVWGPDSIQAMQNFERRLELFKPSRPVNGMPLGDDSPHPRGIYPVGRGLLSHSKVETDAIVKEEAEILAKLKAKRESVKTPQKAEETSPSPTKTGHKSNTPKKDSQPDADDTDEVGDED